MEKLKNKAESLAEATVEKTRADVKAALDEELPDRFSIEETDEGVIVSGGGIGAEMVENNSLRDVAFLMRGVR